MYIPNSVICELRALFTDLISTATAINNLLDKCGK